MKTEEENSYLYRNGNENDIGQMQALGLAAYGQFQYVLPKEGWEKMAANCGSRETYLDLLSKGQSFVCVDGDKFIGMAFLIPSGNPFMFFQSSWSYIRLVAVAPGYEGRGIGRKLTMLCVQHAKQTGEKIVALHTSEFQSAARHIYESMGFTVLKALDPMYGKCYWLYTLDMESLALSFTPLKKASPHINRGDSKCMTNQHEENTKP